MGVAHSFGVAFRKGLLSGGQILPKKGRVFMSVREADKPKIIPLAKQLIHLGFEVMATRGTFNILQAHGVPVELVNKVHEARPHIVDHMKNGEVQFVINTVDGALATADSFLIRRTAIQQKICYTTTLAGAEAACLALASPDDFDINSLQELHSSM